VIFLGFSIDLYNCSHTNGGVLKIGQRFDSFSEEGSCIETTISINHQQKKRKKGNETKEKRGEEWWKCARMC
jgi:D-alanyl-D-alanine dipeptidase